MEFHDTLKLFKILRDGYCSKHELVYKTIYFAEKKHRSLHQIARDCNFADEEIKDLPVENFFIRPEIAHFIKRKYIDGIAEYDKSIENPTITKKSAKSSVCLNHVVF